MESLSLDMHNEILRESVAIAIAETKKVLGAPFIEQPIGIEEAASFTGLEVKTIYNLVGKGEIPFYKKGKLHFYKTELNRWIKSGRCKSTKALRKEKVDKMLTHGR